MEPPSAWILYDHEVEVSVTVLEILLIFTILAFRLWPQRYFLKGLVLELIGNCLPSGAKPADENNPVERRVREECKRLHLLRAELFLIGQNIGYLLQSCVHLLNITTATPTFSHATVVWAVILFSGNALFAVSPRCMTPRTVDFIYCYNILLWCVFLLLQDGDEVQVHNARVNLMSVALYLGFLDLKPWLNTLGILAFASTETVMLARCSNVWMSTWGPYLTLLFVLLGANLLFKRGVRMMILGRDFENELTAAKMLLSSICDVTLHLDAGLRLKEHSPKLADILFHGPGRSYEGTDIRELMAGEEDREIFTEHMGISSEEAQARADVFHARMRDGTGAPVAMEFFSVAFRGQDAALHRCIGLREHTDIAPVVRAPPPPAVKVKMPKKRVAPALIGTPAEHLQADLRSHAGSRSSASSAGDDGHHAPGRRRGSTASASCADGDGGHNAGAGPSGSTSSAPRASGDGGRDVRAGGQSGSTSDARAGGQSSSTSSASNAGGDAGRDAAAGRSGSTSSASRAGRTSGGGASRKGAAVMETADLAKETSISFALRSWSLAPAAAACCPKHAAVAALRRLLPRLEAAECVSSFRPLTKWQCSTCGICASEWRISEGRSRCTLCEGWSEAQVMEVASKAQTKMAI